MVALVEVGVRVGWWQEGSNQEASLVPGQGDEADARNGEKI